MVNYNQKKFKIVSVSNNGELSSSMVFEYFQTNNILTCSYKGGTIQTGSLIGVVSATGNIEMTYMQINENNVINTGKCSSILEVLPNGKYRLHEKWQWTSGDLSSGTSILEEV
jgi:hypothetical protein